jgi:transposase
MLSPEQQTEILSLHFSKKMKVRAIARQLGINRKSVQRVVDRRSVTLGIQVTARSSRLDDFKAQIEKLLVADPSIPAVVCLQRIRDQGYDGGYTILREWLKARRPLQGPRSEAFFKIDFLVGQAAQVDWGEFGDVFGDGIKYHCFVMVLCYSRLLYIEFTRSEKFEDFIRCHENAFHYFEDRIPEVCWYDNLPAAVTERMGSLIRFNARFLAYAGHHHFAPHACNKARGNEKGRVEDGVKYIRYNFWPGRAFRDFADLCTQASLWRDQTANLREHRATRKIPRLLFEGEERERLREKNPATYETDEVFSEEIRPDYHIAYETNQYSVPCTLVGSVVTVRIDAEWVRIYYRENFVTKHQRCYLKHQKPFTQPKHEEGLLATKPQGKNAHQTWQIQVLESYGPELKRYLGCLPHSQRSLRAELSRLLALGTVYGVSALKTAVGDLLKRGSIGSDQVELALKRGISGTPAATALQPAPMNFPEGDPRLTRIPPRIDLRQYDQLILNRLERSAASLDPPPEQTTGSQKA